MGAPCSVGRFLVQPGDPNKPILHEKRNTSCPALLKQVFTFTRQAGVLILRDSMTFNLLNVNVAFEMGLTIRYF